MRKVLGMSKLTPKRKSRVRSVQPTAARPPSSSLLALPRSTVLLLAGLCAAVPLGYALFTHHVWEDYFITFRYSRNLCEGKGLVYTEGERVHGFTSPLGVLAPALCYALTGNSSYMTALWMYRAISIASFAGGALLLFASVVSRSGISPLTLPRAAGTGAEATRTAFAPTASTIAGVFAVLLYVLDIKAVAFSTNGQETGFMLLFMAWALYLFQADDCRHWLRAGFAGRR